MNSEVQKAAADVVTQRADKLVLRTVDWVYDEARKRVMRHRRAKLARELLLIDAPRGSEIPVTAYRSASGHSLTGKVVHPDNLDPLLSFVNDDFARVLDPSDESADLVVVDDLAVPVGHDQVRFGSPTSDLGARVLFGYGKEGDDNRLIREIEPIEFPLYWELEDVGDGWAYRYVPGRGKVGRPLWRIVTTGTRKPWVPEVDQTSGLLRTDYLLVTRVRNYLGGGWRGGHFIVTLGGAHGIATRAAGLLSTRTSELAKAHEELRRLAGRGEKVPDNFQLLFRVGNIKHDEQSCRSIAHEIRFEAAERIDDNDQQWADATKLVQPALDAWQVGSGEDVRRS